MSSPVELVLAKLDGVRNAAGGWSAKCPAHKDRSASLSVGEGSNGGVLLHCFAGCSAHDITAAIGLSLSDLFPPREQDQSPEGRKRLRAQMRLVGWGAALPVLEFESRIVLLAARDIAAGALLDDGDMARLEQAVARIESARTELAPADYARTARELRDQHMARAAAEPVEVQG